MLKLRRGPIASYNLHYKLHHLNIITLEYSSKQYLYFLALKLRVERTRKSLVRNSRVLSGFSQLSTNQYLTTIPLKIRNITTRKNIRFCSKRSPFTLQRDSFCNAIVALLHAKKAPFTT